MSAPTAFDAGALVSGLAWSVRPQAPTSTQALEPYEGDERRSLARIAHLTRAYNDLCTQAVDPFEIAAGLEAAGISDRKARAEYGAASVFELADAMYALVPRRPSHGGTWVDPWQRPVARHLLRGLLYGLPGLLYAVALTMLQQEFDAVLLLVATIVASGLGQGLSLLGHALIGRRQNEAAMSLFRTALVLGGLLGAFIMVASWLSGSLSPAVVLAGCQFAYLLAATLLMVIDASFLLLSVLAPAVLLAIVELSGAAVIPRGATIAVLALCVAAAVVAAWSKLDVPPGATITHLRAGFGLSRSDVALGAGYVVYGLATAGLVAFAVVDVIGRHGSSAAGSIALMMLPLVASLGVAEWLVYRLRSRGLTLLRETSSIEGFRTLASAEVARAVVGYASVLAALTCAVIFVFPQEAALPFVVNICAYGVLGLALFCSTILLSVSRHWLALGLAMTALVVDSALRWTLAPASPEALATMHLAVFVMLFAAVLPAVGYYYTRAGSHR